MITKTQISIIVCCMIFMTIGSFDTFGQIVQCNHSDGSQNVCLIGENGTGNGQFTHPHDIAVSSTNIFVADTNNHRIQIFDNNGNFVKSFGSEGTGHDQFSHPHGIAVSPTNIFVADTNNHRIQIFDNNGNFIKSFGCNYHIYDLDTYNTYDLNVYPSCKDKIIDHIKNPDIFGEYTTPNDHIKHPHSITFNSTHLFVASGGMQILDHNGNYVTVSYGYDPHDIAVSQTYIFVVDANNHKIEILDNHISYLEITNGFDDADNYLRPIFPRGDNFVNLFSIKSSDNDQFSHIHALTANSTHLFVADFRYNQIQVFDIDFIANLFISPISDITTSVNTTRSIDVNLSGFVDKNHDAVFDEKDDIVYTISNSEDIVEISKTGIITITISPYESSSLVFVNVIVTQDSVSIDESFTIGIVPPFGNDRYHMPTDVATSSTSLFVSYHGHNIINVYDHNGIYVNSFGSKGIHDSRFSYITGLATSSTHIFVANSSNNVIKIYDHNGIFVNSIGSKGSEPGQFRNPEDVATNSTHFFVVDTDNNRIQIFDNAGNHVKSFGSKGSGPGQFYSPGGITTNSTHLFVADTHNNRIQIFDNAGNHVKSFGSKGSGQDQFYIPSSITTSPTHLFVADTHNHRIQIFDHAGNHVKSFGIFGYDHFLLHYPSGIDISSTHLFVVDSGNPKIKIFDLSFVLHPILYPVLDEIVLNNPYVVGNPLSISVAATDLDYDDVSFTLFSNVTGDNTPEINPNFGVISWTPNMTQIGNHQLNITANYGKHDSDTVRINITVIDPNPSLHLNDTLRQTIYGHDALYRYTYVTWLGSSASGLFASTVSVDDLGIIYVTNEDDTLIKTLLYNLDFFASGLLDDPRRTVMGPVFVDVVSAIDELNNVDNIGPSFVLVQNGTIMDHSFPLLEKETIFTVHALDPDGDNIKITAHLDNMQNTGLTTIDHQNGTATIIVNTNLLSTRVIIVWITAYDGYDYSIDHYIMIRSSDLFKSDGCIYGCT